MDKNVSSDNRRSGSHKVSITVGGGVDTVQCFGFCNAGKAKVTDKLFTETDYVHKAM